MSGIHLFVPAFARSRHLWLSCGSLLLLVACLCLEILPAHSATKHGCAPGTPPPVSGTPVAAPSSPGIVMINEVLNQPASTWNCSEPSGTHSLQEDSWIELFNTQNQPLDLYGGQGEISLDGGSDWYYLPAGSVIASGGFLVIFPLGSGLLPLGNSPAQPSSPATWDVVLAFSGVTIDQANVPQLQADQSYARVPDGSSNWQLVGDPTIAASNNPSAQPIVPTPTKTPTPVKPPKSSNGGGNGSGTNNLTPSPSTNNGTQPSWSQVQFSSGETTPTAGPLTPLDTSPPGPVTKPSDAATQSNGLDGGRIALVTTLLVLLLSALFCGWRLFRTP